jgi:hypothetical protein
VKLPPTLLLVAQVAAGQGQASRYQVVGRLLDDHSGAPIVAALVIGPELGDTATTGPDGRFTLQGEAVPQCYRLQLITASHVLTEVSADLLEDWRVDIGDQRLDSTSATAIRLRRHVDCHPPGGPDRWDWTVAYGTIRGRVTTPFGLVRAGASVRTDCPAAAESVRTDGAGYYRLDLRIPYTQRARLIPSGRLTCRVWTEGEEADTLTPAVRFGPTPWAQPAAIASYGAPRLHSTGPVVLTGRLIDPHDRAPLVGAEILIVDLHVRATTDSVGAFRLPFRSPPGCMRLEARFIGYDPAEGLIRIDGPTARDLGDVPLQPAISGPATHPIPSAQDGCVPSSPAPPQQLARFGSVAGRLTDPAGTARQNELVRLACGWRGHGISARSEATSDENGVFTLDIGLSPWIVDSLNASPRWTCRLGSTPLPLRLGRDLLRVTPLILDQAASRDGTRR